MIKDEENALCHVDANHLVLSRASCFELTPQAENIMFHKANIPPSKDEEVQLKDSGAKVIKQRERPTASMSTSTTKTFLSWRGVLTARHLHIR